MLGIDLQAIITGIILAIIFALLAFIFRRFIWRNMVTILRWIICKWQLNVIINIVKKEWAYLLSFNKDNKNSSKLLLTFIKRYYEEEKSDISRTFVVTNFQSYSGFVEVLINKSVTMFNRDGFNDDRKRENKKIYLLTALGLPLIRWFNYNKLGEFDKLLIEKKFIGSKITKQLPYEYLGTSDEWHNYIESIKKLAIKSKEKEINVEIKRYIITTINKHKGINCYDDIVKEANNWIACNSGGIKEPLLLNKKNIDDIISNWNEYQSLSLFYSSLKDNISSYIIIPSSISKNNLPGLPQGICWERLGNVFARLYQNYHGNAFIVKLDDNDYQQFISKLPLDFFLIGIGPCEYKFSEISWLFCLSATDVDEYLDKLKLYFLTKQLEKYEKAPFKLDDIVDYISRCFNNKEKTNKITKVVVKS